MGGGRRFSVFLLVHLRSPRVWGFHENNTIILEYTHWPSPPQTRGIDGVPSGGPSRRSSMRRPGSKDPIGASKITPLPALYTCKNVCTKYQSGEDTKLSFVRTLLTPMGVLAHLLLKLDCSLIPPSAWSKINHCRCRRVAFKYGLPKLSQL